MGIGFREILVILLIIVLVFGARRIPQIMGDFAKGIRSFRQGMSEDPDAKTGDAKPAEEPRKLPDHSGAAAEAAARRERTDA